LKLVPFRWYCLRAVLNWTAPLFVIVGEVTAAGLGKSACHDG
jgi:hypothetical protein